METILKELYFKIADSQYELNHSYRLRFKVYCMEKRWLSPEDYPNGLEIDEYDEKAIQVVALDEDFRVVGLMRILRGKDFARLPFLDHPGMKNKQVDIPNVAELSRFVITSTHNRSQVLRGLIRAVYQISKKAGIENWVFVSEPSMVRLHERFKFYFDPMCTPTKYYGGFTLVARCDIRRTEAKWIQNDNEALYFNQAKEAMLQPKFEFA